MLPRRPGAVPRGTRGRARAALPRATTSHNSVPPKRANGAVKRTERGFHEGPVVVSRSRWTISRPQTIHAQGSYVGVESARA